MKPTEVKREDLVRTLAERSPLSESQAQEELDRMVHGIVTSLRKGLSTEMPGVGRMSAKPPAKKSPRGDAKRTPAAKASVAKTAARQPRP
jgi:nucleoid DNA-binding protein